MSRWDGAPKGLTTDCSDCPFFLTGHGADRLLARHRFPKAVRALGLQERRLCIWGVAVKTLVQVERPRKCAIRDKRAPGAAAWMALIEQKPWPPAPLFEAGRPR